MQAKAKAKLATTSAIAAVSNQTTSTTAMPSVSAVVTSAITTPMHSGQGSIHAPPAPNTAPPNAQQQQQPQPPPHSIVAPHIPILMDPLVQSNYLISI